MPRPKVLLAFDITRKLYLSEIASGIINKNRLDPVLHCDLFYPRNFISYSTPLAKIVREYDGVIAEIREHTIDIFRSMRKPLVTVGSEGLHLNQPWVGPDHTAIAEHIAECLISRGFKHVAYFHTESFPFPYSRTIKDRLEHHCEQNQLNFHVFCHDISVETDDAFYGEQQIDELAKFLKCIPKPCVLIAPDDHFAWRGIQACQKARCKVPEEISVFGIRSDDYICELSNPPISHQHINYNTIGQVAAELIYKKISGEKIPHRTYVGHGQLRERESSSLSAHQDETLSRALQYIEKNLHQNITVDDIAMAAGVSSRTLHRSFLKILGQPPVKTLRDHRLSRAKKLLNDKSIPLVEVAELCGLSDQSQLNRLVKAGTGQTPNELRLAHGL